MGKNSFEGIYFDIGDPGNSSGPQIYLIYRMVGHFINCLVLCKNIFVKFFLNFFGDHECFTTNPIQLFKDCL